MNKMKTLKKLEDEIVAKYGFEFEDFNKILPGLGAVTGRDLFDYKLDTEDFLQIVNYFFAEYHKEAFIEDIKQYQEKRERLSKILEQLQDYYGFENPISDFSFEYFLEQHKEEI